MSITFSPTRNNHKPQTKEEECYCDYSEPGKFDPGCSKCDGTGISYVPDMPEMNLSNTNGMTILKIIFGDNSPKVDYYGDIMNNEIPDVIRKIISIINRPKTMSKHTRPDEQENNFYSMGIDEDYIKDRLNSLMEILKYAQEHNEDVSWD